MSLLAILAITPAVASADTASPDPAYGPTLGDGYVYWVSASHERGDGTYSTNTLNQRRLSDGRTRAIFKLHRSIATGLYARGDKVAFALTQAVRDASRKRSGRSTDVIYAMSSEDAKPTQILTSKGTISPKLKFCGDSNYLHDVSTSGQVLFTKARAGCPRGKAKTAGWLYSMQTGTTVPVNGMSNALFAIMQYGRLAIISEYDLKVRDLATGVTTSNFIEGEAPYWVALSADGTVATSTEDDYSWRRGKALTDIRIIPPGNETEPTAQIKEWLDGDPVILFCAGGLAELNIPSERKIVIRLRALDGSVTKRLDGPRFSGNEVSFDSTCSNNHLSIAISKTRSSKAPKIYSYDL